MASDRQNGPRTVDDFAAMAGRFQSDRQVHDLYDAEERFMSEPPPGQQRFADVREAQKWARTLSDTPEFRAAYPQAAAWLARNPVTVKRSSAKQRIGCAMSGTGQIGLSSFDDGVGMVLSVMLHEFSHVVHGASPADGLQEAHGPEYTSVYLDMVALVCGDVEAERLLRDFDRTLVSIDLDRRRVTSAGEGLLASGRLPRPSRLRTPESVRAARDARFARSAEKQALKIVERRPEAGFLASFVRLNGDYFERAVEVGADLPPEILRHIPGTPPPTQAAMCGKRMPRARRNCVRAPGHRGACR